MEIKVQSRGRKVQLQIGKLNPIRDRIVQLRIGNSNYRSENKFLLEIGLRNGRTRRRRRRRRKQTIKTARAEARGQKEFECLTKIRGGGNYSNMVRTYLCI